MSDPCPHLVLASGSPRRLDLLRRLGLEPTVRPVDIDETPQAGEAAEPYVARLAREKAEAAPLECGEIVLAADTIVALDGRLLGKPHDAPTAAAMLRDLSGRRHQVMTGVAVRVPRDGGDSNAPDAIAVEVVTTHVDFARLTDQQIAWYVATGEPMDKAGAYGIQGAGGVFVDRVEGSDTNVVGLPLAVAARMLAAAGLDPFAS